MLKSYEQQWISEKERRGRLEVSVIGNNIHKGDVTNE